MPETAQLFSHVSLLAFLGVGGMLFVLVMQVVPAWLSRPERRLTLTIVRTAKLVDESIRPLEVTREGKEISDPSIVEISIRNTGRRSISSELFKGAPLTVDLSAPAHALACDARRYVAHALSAEVSGSEVSIHPRFIFPGQHKEFTVLTEGEPNLEINSKFAGMLVDIRPGTELKESQTKSTIFTQWTMRLAALGAAAATVASVGIAVWRLSCQEKSRLPKRTLLLSGLT